MVRKNVVQRKLSKLLGDRKGTAEIIGTVMFLVILLFVFTNVYLWHDTATREMNTVLAEKMNSPVSISVNKAENCLNVTNNGGFEVGLSRLWLVNATSGSATDHVYVDLEYGSSGQSLNVRIASGATIRLVFVGESAVFNPDGSIQAEVHTNGEVWVHYPVPDHEVRCKILTSLRNMAACTFYPSG
jgi:hypothetical protein